jgi:ASCH domain-containing protein
MKGLIIDEPWIGLILKGEKTWEMRSGTWKHRGLIGLIRKKSGHVVGIAELTDNRPPLTNLVAYAEAENFHRIPPDRQGTAFAGGWTTPWVLKNAQPLRRPVPYIHPNGAVKSVNLSDDVAAQVQRQLAG